MNIGKLIQQPGGYKAFIPEKFPPDKKIEFYRIIIKFEKLQWK